MDVQQGGARQVRSKTKRRRHGTLRRVIAGTAAVMLATLGAASAASAAAGWWSYVGDTSIELGANVWNDGEVVGFCTMDEDPGPFGAGFPQTAPEDFYSVSTVKAGEAYTPNASTTSGGRDQRVTAANTGALAYLVYKGTPYGAAGSNTRTMEYHYAINDLAVDGAFQNASSSIKSAAADLIAEAKANAGPYAAGEPTITLTQGSGTVSNLGVVESAKGNKLSGYTWTATLSGAGATWDSTGSKTLTGKTGSSASSAAFTATSNGKVEVSISITGLPADTVKVYRHARAQDLFVTGPSSSASAKADPGVVVLDFLPSITSSVKSFAINEGQTFKDTVTLGVADGEWPSGLSLKFVSTLYGYEDAPPAQSGTVPSGAKKLETVEWTATGPGTYDVESTQAAAAGSGGGYAAWTTSVMKADQSGDAATFLRADVVDGYFIPSETHVVRVTPSVETEVADKLVRAGDPAIDQLTLTLGEGQSWPKDRDGKIVEIPAVATLYKVPGNYPVAQSASVPAGATKVGSETVTFSAEGTINTSGDLAYPSEGGFTWVVEIEGTDFYEGFVSDFGIEVETAVARYEITHASTTREYNVVPGGRAFDQITIGGIPSWHGQWDGLGEWAADVTEATVTVYGPVAEAPSTTEVPAGTPVFWEDTVEFKNGTINVGYDEALPVQPTEGGYYVFVYSYAGDTVIAPFQSAFDDVMERFYVPGPQEPEPVAPSVITRAVAVVMAGVPATDEAIVSGNVEEGSQLVWDYYVTEREDTAAECVAPTAEEIKALLAAGPAGTLGPITVNEAAIYTSPEIDTTDLGGNCIWWVERLLGPDGEVLDEGGIGTPGETTRVVEPEREITVTTKARSDEETPRVGEEIWDTIQVEGTIKDGDFVVVDLYTWETGSAPTCENPVWSSDPIDLVDGTTEYTTGTYVTLEAVEHGFVETTYNAEGEIISQGVCGEPDETITVEDNPTVTTKLIAYDKDGKETTGPVVGDTIADTVTVDGVIREGDYTIVELFVAKGDTPTCTDETKVWTSDRISLVPGTTQYVTEEWTTTTAATHYYLETTFDKDGNELSKGVCGEPDETIKVSAGDAGSGAAGLANTGAGGTIAMAGLAAALVAAGVGLNLRKRGNATA